MTTADVSVVIVTHNSADVVRGALENLPPDSEVIVVDNRSTDDVAATIRDARANTRLILNAENRGFGAACNIGAKESTRPLLLFLNPDACIDRESLDILVTRLLRERGAAMVGPAILGHDGETKYVCRRFSRPLADVLGLVPLIARRIPPRARVDIPAGDRIYRLGGRVDYLQGACLLISREIYARVGGFDERFFLYSEEEDLALRLRRHGIPCYYEPAASALHAWGTSTAKVGAMSVHHFYRSKVLLHTKYLGRARARLFGVFALCALAAEALMLPGHRVKRSGTTRDLRWFRAAASGLIAGLK
jgi:GT2 family glycosyltransferase